MQNLPNEKTPARSIVPLAMLLALCCLLLPGCRSLCARGEEFKPRGELLAYVKIKWAAFSQMPKGECGTFFYVEYDSSMPRLACYEVWDGRVSFSVRGGEPRIVRDLEAIGFEPFDYDREADSLSEETVRKTLPPGHENDAPWALDGVVQEIFVHTDKGDFCYTLPNAYTSIEYYAHASDRIARLKAYLDTLATFLGRARMALNI